MRGLALPAGPLRILALGAHPDDLEIGAGGLLARLVADRKEVHLRWVVLTAEGDRRREAEEAARRLLDGAASVETRWHAFRDGFLPARHEPVKEALEALKEGSPPDLILTHWRGDAHQDHRLVAELTLQTFRDHLCLEYEVPKYDGDLGRPSLYLPLSRREMEAKCRLLQEVFASQSGRDWFDAELFTSLARLRGMECRAPEGYAEAFHLHKAVLDVAGSTG